MAQSELHPRRYIFHGHASGVSAHIRRPETRLLPVQGCSSLPVIGGLSESKVGPQKLDKWVAFDAVSTSAHGDYVDPAEGVATTTGAVAELVAGGNAGACARAAAHPSSRTMM